MIIFQLVKNALVLTHKCIKLILKRDIPYSFCPFQADLSFPSLFKMNMNENTHKNVHHCCPFPAILIFFTPSPLLFCIFSRDKQLSVLPKMPQHIMGLLSGCIVAMKNRKVIHSERRKEPSPANGLN